MRGWAHSRGDHRGTPDLSRTKARWTPGLLGDFFRHVNTDSRSSCIAHVKLVEVYAKAQGLFRLESTPDPVFSETLALDLSTVEPSLAGPRRPQDRVPLAKSKQAFQEALPAMVAKQAKPVTRVEVRDDGKSKVC